MSNERSKLDGAARRADLDAPLPSEWRAPAGDTESALTIGCSEARRRLLAVNPVSDFPHMLADWEIESLAKDGMITPFEARSTSKDGAVSHGLTPCGYDIRLGAALMIARPDVRWRPGNQRPEDFEEHTLVEGEPFVLPAGRLVLGHTIERFRLPAHIVGHCKGKSTWARCGLQMYDPPCEPGWGLRAKEAPQLTLELFPTVDVVVFLGDGIAQMQFTRILPPRRDYSVVGGKYNDQDGVVLSRRA